MKNRKWAAILALAALVVGSAHASLISVDFNNTTDGAWTITGTETAGPLSSAYWNSTTTASGTIGSLLDDSGATTTASITWSAVAQWTNGDGNSTTDRQLAHSYLDETASNAISITMSNIPYAQYRVYGLVASDNMTAIRNWDVNGAWVLGGNNSTTAAAYGTVAANITAHGVAWTKIDPGVTTGNYWTIETTGGTLNITGLVRSGTVRGSITGLIVEQIPEPATLGVVMASLAAMLVRRRRSS